MDSTPTDIDGIWVHQMLMSNKALYFCGSAVPAIRSTFSNRSNGPFPPPGWSQGLFSSGHSINYSLLVNMTWRSFRSNISPSVLSEDLPTGNWSRFILDKFSVVVVFLSTHLCCWGRGRFSIPLPHVLSMVTQLKQQVTS